MNKPLKNLSWLLGGCVALLTHATPADAATPKSQVLLSQRVERSLPPPPPVRIIPYGQEQLPQDSFTPREFDFSVPSTNIPNSPNFERYLVYVDNNSPGVLQQVRLVEPTAYIREYRGRFIIQAGVFSRQSNARQRLQELENLGISNTQVVSFGSGQEIPDIGNDEFVSDRQRQEYQYDRPRQSRDYQYVEPASSRSRRGYFVAIPTSSTELPYIVTRVRRSQVANEAEIRPRYAPRGTHVSVGPFSRREDAERWNNYLRSLGFSNARVYFGR